MNNVQTTPSTITAKFSGGPKRMATAAMAGAKNVITITPSVPATKEPLAAMPSAAAARRAPRALPGASLLRHLVPVEAGHDRRGLARYVQQDRGRRAAIHRAVEDR